MRRAQHNLAYDDRPVRVRECNSPGCTSGGEFRAPKNRELSDYYWFCLDHVREYNRSWDYFAGMNTNEVETYNRKATVWERPSWPMGEWKRREQELRDAVHRTFFTDGDAETPVSPPPSASKAEAEALGVLGLTFPASFVDVKARYKILVKQHHPDANGGSRAAEETFKNITRAFSLLKDMHSQDEIVR